MENGGYMFVREQSGNNNNSNSNNLAWENTWALHNHHSRFDLGSSSSSLYRNTTAETTNATLSEGNATHALLFPHTTHRSLYAGVGSNLHPDPHLMCLKLGKRHYFEDSTAAPMGQRHVDGAGGYSMVKKGKPYYTYSGCGDGVGLPSSSAPVLVSSTATVPRCQVDGCHVALINSKEYHRRHKVCEMHSKAPKVMVLGLEQRFCQQCSRFHVVSEFDDTKRSCRRRLAGHNERRRKSSHDSLSRNSSQVNKLVSGRLRSPATGRALSLLSSSSSSSKAGSWVSSSDLSSRCSAALRELIAENRAAILARHLILDGRDWNLHNYYNANHEDHPQTGSDSFTSNHHYLYQQHQIILTEQQQQQQQQQNNWERYQETNTHVTLDLMQAPSEEEECSELWTSLEDDHVV